MEVRLHRISGDSSGAGLRWIYLDPVHLRSCGYKYDLSDLQLSSLAMVAALVCWSFEALARRLPTVYYNKVCPAPAMEGR